MTQLTSEIAAAQELLAEAINSTAEDFILQVRDFVPEVPEEDQGWVSKIDRNFCAIGYAFLDAQGSPIVLGDLQEITEQISNQMRNYADNGWSAFLPLSYEGRQPQRSTEFLLNRNFEYLEGMRLPALGALHSMLDYWRIYQTAMCINVASFWEDSPKSRRDGQPDLSAFQSLFRIHSVLAHARLLGQETPDVEHVVFGQDWRGLNGRVLRRDHAGHVVSHACRSDRFPSTITFRWSDLQTGYLETFCRVSSPLLEMFPRDGWSPHEWLNREFLQRLFDQFRHNVRLFDD